MKLDERPWLHVSPQLDPIGLILMTRLYYATYKTFDRNDINIDSIY